MTKYLEIDGSQGEGGGQILRTSLALALVTGRAIRIREIRKKRSKPGLMRQHLTAVRAAGAIGGSRLEGDALGSTELSFAPGTVSPGEYHFAVGTAGSAMLVLQTVLPPLLLAGGPSSLTLEGGTHNPHAPCFDFLVRTFLPQLARMGIAVQARLERVGYYPSGGGRVKVEIEPWKERRALELLERGEIRAREIEARVAGIPRNVAEREVRTALTRLAWREADSRVVEQPRDWGPGNVILVTVESPEVTEVISAYGERGVRAESVAEAAAEETSRYVDAGAPVGEHLADQLLLPMALGPGGTFRTGPPTEHTRTNIDVIKRFLPVNVTLREQPDRSWRLSMEAGGG